MISVFINFSDRYHCLSGEAFTIIHFKKEEKDDFRHPYFSGNFQ
jgi:hypothetical protein